MVHLRFHKGMIKKGIYDFVVHAQWAVSDIMGFITSLLVGLIGWSLKTSL